MKSELNLFIIWEKAYDFKEKIISDIEEKFKILDIYEVMWDKQKFSENLTRFYGQKLPKNSFKERHCGNGPFTLIIVNDLNPIYKGRITSRGEEIVNINMFDAKQLYRNWTGGGHKIHSTNSESETNHDITLLLGINVKDYLAKHTGKWDNKVKPLIENIVGCDGWKDINTVFYVLNSTHKYIVMRNYEYLIDKELDSEHEDIDLLVDNYDDIAYLLNGTKVFNKKYRVLNKVKVNGKDVIFDFRFIGDNYYDEKFERCLLETRELIGKGLYVPNKLNYFYSLLYHAIIHKTQMAKDYKLRLVEMAKELDINSVNIETIDNNDKLKNELDKFMNANRYEYTEPNDISVYYNSKLLNNNITNKRFINQSIINLKKRVKSIIN